jgi:hypothetical protein
MSPGVRNKVEGCMRVSSKHWSPTWMALTRENKFSTKNFGTSGRTKKRIKNKQVSKQGMTKAISTNHTHLHEFKICFLDIMSSSEQGFRSFRTNQKKKHFYNRNRVFILPFSSSPLAIQ